MIELYNDYITYACQLSPRNTSFTRSNCKAETVDFISVLGRACSLIQRRPIRFKRCWNSHRQIAALQIHHKLYMCSDLLLNRVLPFPPLPYEIKRNLKRRGCFCLRLCWSWNLIDVVTVKHFTWRFPSVCTVRERQEVCCCLNSCSEC